MSSTNKRRRVKVERVVHTVLDLLQEGVPELCNGNSTIQSSTAHVEDIGHDEAAVLEHPIPFPDELPFTVGGVEASASLLLELHGGLNDGVTYQNETKIQNLVLYCLNDALSMLDLKADFQVESEFSIFSYRPDILVVSHSMLGIILVVEVKKPGAEVFTSHEPGGQVYDYLIGNLLAGVSHPFAVLTTYDEMVIAHLDDDMSKDILKSNVENLGSDFSQDVLDMLEIKESGDEKVQSAQQSSPKSKLNRVFDNTGSKSEETPDDDDGEEDDNNDDYSRAIIYTQPFRGKEIMKALLLAIRCGLESVARSQPRTIPMEGASADGTCALVNEKGLVWRTMPTTIRFTYYQFPGSTTQKLYLWRDLGRGANGRVFLACNTKGKACAVKFFIIDDNIYHRRKSPKETRKKWREIQMAHKKQEAETERDYWIHVNGDSFKDQVRVVQWNKLWCLMMPYFDPLANERREQSLPAVKKFLESCKSKGLRYCDEDLCWRHVGTRGNDVFVFDLGSLEKCEKEDGFDIQGQIDTLKGKIS